MFIKGTLLLLMAFETNGASELFGKRILGCIYNVIKVLKKYKGN